MAVVKENSHLVAQALATEYRLALAPRRSTGKVIERKKPQDKSETGTLTVRDDFLHVRPKFQWITKEELDKEFDHYNYDSEEDEDFERGAKGNISQVSYLSVCRQLKVTPSKLIYCGLGQNKIILKNQRLSLSDVKALTISLVKNVNVKSLTLDANEMCAGGAGLIASIIPQKLELLELNITNNLLGSKGAEMLCNELTNNTIIRKVNFSGNNFNEDDAVHFKELLEENNSIIEMNLSHNNFQEVGGKILAEGIEKNDFLKVLDLSWNHLRMSGAVAIGKSLKENSTLEVLRVGWNGFHLRGCMALGESLSENSTLTELDLTCNRITDLCLGQLLKAFHTNTTLKIIKLPLNQLSPNGCDIILTMIEKHNTLGVQLVDLGNQSVKEGFPRQAVELKRSRNITFRFGPIIRAKIQFNGQKKKSDSLEDEDPFLVLMVYMRLQNLRVLELFSNMDKDMSKNVTRQEFKDGMKSVNIPLTDRQLDKLINVLDNDRDGNVDFSELMSGQKDYKQRMYTRGSDVTDGDEESEVERVSRKVEIIMSKRHLMRKF